MSDSSLNALYQVAGHDMEVVKRYRAGGELLVCRDCLTREAVQEEEDHSTYLRMVLPDECHIEWLREPEGKSRGVALRNAHGFRGRELIAVDSDNEVTDKVRVYDEDAPLLAGMLDMNDWERRE